MKIDFPLEFSHFEIYKRFQDAHRIDSGGEKRHQYAGKHFVAIVDQMCAIQTQVTHHACKFL